MTMLQTLSILYDSECPFCIRYVKLLRLRKNMVVNVISARQPSALRDKVTITGLDLDHGMVVDYDGKLYYGAQAVFILSALSTPSDLFNRLMMQLFKSQKLAAFFYPPMAFFRRFVLLIQQKNLIGNIPDKPPKKFLGLFVDVPVRKIAANPILLSRFCMRLTAFCLLFTILYSYDLWFTQERIFLAVPIFQNIFNTPFFLTQFCSACVVVSCAILFFFPQKRAFGLLAVAAMIFLVLQDELRWQPFVYMYGFVLFILSVKKEPDAIREFSSLRYMAVGIYFWAGFYKINYIFILYIFPWFVSPLHLNSQLVFVTGCYVPFIECTIGIFLFFQRTRVYGIILATMMLIVVLLCLGPLGHNWGQIVWPWNVLLHALELILFLYYRGSLLETPILKDRLVWLAILLFWLMPALALIGKWGAHPSFMLYSGIPDNADIQFDPREDISFLPLMAQAGIENQNRLPLTYIVYYTFRLTPVPSLPGSHMLTAGAQGLCPHLHYPDQAKLIISTLPHLWSPKYTQHIVPLCPVKAP